MYGSVFRVQNIIGEKKETRDSMYLSICVLVFKRYVNEMYNVKLSSTLKKKKKKRNVWRLVPVCGLWLSMYASASLAKMLL